MSIQSSCTYYIYKKIYRNKNKYIIIIIIIIIIIRIIIKHNTRTERERERERERKRHALLFRQSPWTSFEVTEVGAAI